MKVLSLDVETTSDADLRKVGASRYAADPSTICSVAAWCFDDGPIQSVSTGHPLTVTDFPEVVDHIRNGGRVRAWNAFFEYCVLRSVFGLDVRPAQFSCTMQRALYSGLPGALGDCGPALKLPIVKNKAAHTLMMRCAKPIIRPDGSRAYYWDVTPGALMDLELYCRDDVAAEMAIGAYVAPLPPTERRLSVLDRASNARGVRVDIPLIQKMIVIADQETRSLNARTAGLTSGAVTNAGTQVQRLLAWLATRGLKLPDLGKRTVSSTLDSAHDAGVDPTAVLMLSIRRRIAKSSLTKLKTMLAAVEADGKIRGTLAYYGAARTGRFAGRIIQPQNFPRPEGFPEIAIEGILDGLDGDGLRLIHGEPLSVLSHALRGVLIPSPGKLIVALDLSQIEARMICWVCDQLDALQVFRDGHDIYQWTADQIGLPTRQAGKATVLGLGFGQGFERFVEFAGNYGVELTKTQSLQIVTDWRAANSAIVSAWWEIGRVVRSVIEAWWRDRSSPLVRALSNRVAVSCVSTPNGEPLLTILLPSGRRLFYRNPRLVFDPEKDRTGIVFDGIDQYTKKWGPIRTWGSKLIENIVQALARDVITEAAIVVDDTLPELSLLFSVHDELVWEVDEDKAAQAYDAAHKAIVAGAPWNSGLPIAAAGGTMVRYGK